LFGSGEEAEPKQAGEENYQAGIDDGGMTDGAIHSLSAEQRVRCESQHNAEGKGEHPAGKVGAHNFDIWVATAAHEKDDRQGKREG
jgi:hypothetical protein